MELYLLIIFDASRSGFVKVFYIYNKLIITWLTKVSILNIAHFNSFKTVTRFFLEPVTLFLSKNNFFYIVYCF